MAGHFMPSLGPFLIGKVLNGYPTSSPFFKYFNLISLIFIFVFIASLLLLFLLLLPLLLIPHISQRKEKNKLFLFHYNNGFQSHSR